MKLINNSAEVQKVVTLTFVFLTLMVGGTAGLAFSSGLNPLFFILAVGGLLVIAGSLAWSEFGLLLLGILIYTHISQVAIEFYNAPSVAKFIVPMLLGIGILRWFFFKEKPQGNRGMLFLIGIYLFTLLMATFSAQHFETSLSALINLLKDVIIAFAIMMLLRTKESFKHVIWALLISSALIAIPNIIQGLTQDFNNLYGGFALPKALDDSVRIGGPLGDPNFYGQILIFLVPLASDRIIHSSNKLLKPLALIIMVILITALVLTFSRGAFLALLVVLFIMFFYHPPRPLAVIGTVIAITLIIQALPATYSARISTIVDVFEEDESYLTDMSFRGRTSEMLSAWYMFLDHPVLGVGLQNYNREYQNYARDIGLEFRRDDRSAHSLYLEIVAELGILGLLSFSALIIGCIWNLYQASLLFDAANLHSYSTLCTAFAIGIIGYFIAAIFLHDAYPRFVWLYIGIAATIPQIARQNYLKSKSKNDLEAGR